MAAELKELVDKAIRLDKAIKANRKKLEGIKATLQVEALAEIDNKNVKYIELFGNCGSSQIGYKEKLEITNFSKLCGLMGEAAEDNVVREQSVKIMPNNDFKGALIALYKGELEQCDVLQLLANMGLDDKQAKAALKKLKGDYWKDRATLESFGCTGNMEEELDAIRRHKNYELVEKYMDVNDMTEEQWQEFRRTLSLEETLSIGLSYEND